MTHRDGGWIALRWRRGAQLLACCALALAASGCQRLVTEPVEYRSGDTTLKGFLAYDRRVEGRRPGVLVVHEWWGYNDYARRRARMLAEMGYTALAVDMYGDGRQAAHPEEAGQFAQAVMQHWEEAGRARFEAALEFLRRHPSVDPDRIAAIGYCFGGAVVLQAARDGLPLRGVASFHGSLAPVRPAAGPIQAKVLVCHGDADEFVAPEQVAAFEQEMQQAGADLRLVRYPGVLHSFTNPDADRYGAEFDLPLAYDAEADRRSWQELERFLAEVFGS